MTLMAWGVTPGSRTLSLNFQITEVGFQIGARADWPHHLRNSIAITLTQLHHKSTKE
jgi:hypothetical protein